ncbi:hypothetical protein HZB94_04025 [Candidatus Falkowbacteria bacterium]|nr:hypothetical protein [Candidatus Falkowbacteria bacterium]
MDWHIADVDLTQDEEIETSNGFAISKNLSSLIRGGTKLTIKNHGEKAMEFKFSWPYANAQQENYVHQCPARNALSLDIPPAQRLVYQWREI